MAPANLLRPQDPADLAAGDEDARRAGGGGQAVQRPLRRGAFIGRDQVAGLVAGQAAATLLIEQGVNIRVVQEVLGHTRVTTTERYTHVSTPLMRDAGERLASALWGKL
ncbi:hypothetical protein Sros_0196 [Streptosporangium roseum DSM 43021]|uniref:Tyr recombinase domain-containing protein n=1 Tax=Streptosporangium roseum (strain ATCC 12428 / DSM 43021 / JCM 3005 / KCTC 9067 / NCIMB 10171 / NRRL 2505 / NI 9100) TaxID=479432 RepID=D2AZ61_STRRD|nr:hypothetical protein Sros_0196 [Streptosporangium roseum DSM 43021]